MLKFPPRSESMRCVLWLNLPICNACWLQAFCCQVFFDAFLSTLPVHSSGIGRHERRIPGPKCGRLNRAENFCRASAGRAYPDAITSRYRRRVSHMDECCLRESDFADARLSGVRCRSRSHGNTDFRATPSRLESHSSRHQRGDRIWRRFALSGAESAFASGPASFAFDSGHRFASACTTSRAARSSSIFGKRNDWSATRSG